MRINVDSDSPHFWRRHFAEYWPIVVKVDGREAGLVIEADDALGYAEVTSMSSSGTPQICRCGQRLMSRLMFGKVDIVGKRING